MTPPYLSRNYDQNNMNFHLTRSLLSSFKDRVSTNTKLVSTFVIRYSLFAGKPIIRHQLVLANDTTAGIG